MDKLIAMANCNYLPQTQLYEEPTLADHAEVWWAEQGEAMPCRGSQEYLVMYETWANWAFANLSGCKLTGKPKCNECGICRNRKVTHD